MLQRSTWSCLLLSAAVGTAGLLPSGRAWAQEAPASAPAAGQNLEVLASDFMHYSLVNNTELAKANGEALLAAQAKPEEVLSAFEKSSNGRVPRDVLLQDQRRPELKDIASKLLDRLDEGYRNVARDPKRIRDEVDRLAGGPRPYQNAKERLSAAGQFAAPIYLEYLQNAAKKDLHPYILQIMGEIGRPLLLPLIEELRVSDPTLKIELINVIGQIGYPQALPALRAIQADAATAGELKNAVDNAIKLIDRTGRVASMPASDLSLLAAQNYYDKKPSYMPLLSDEKTNPIWIFDSGLNNVAAVQVPTPIWNSVMALRLAEATLKADANNGAAISLWLASSLRREILLPEGEKDPTKGTGPDAAFYARAAGPIYVNPVLTMALDVHDSALTLKAIDALEATGGANGLVAAGENSPLVRALANSDRSVRFHAAFTLARANPNSQYPSFFRVVPILAEAVNSTGSPTALVVSPNQDARNKLTDVLRSGAGHYTVYAGGTLSEALEQARYAPAVDVVIVPGGADVSQIPVLARADYRLSGVPVLVTAPSAGLADLKLKLAGTKGYGAMDMEADDAAVTAALAAARGDIAGVTLDADKATGFATMALDILGTLAADHKSIYNINEAVPTLADALKDKRPEIAASAAKVLGKINNEEGERALASAALGDVDAALKLTFMESLAESAKRTGNALDASVISALIKVVSTEGDAKLKTAAATALGALNVPSNQASTLILQQVK